MRQREMGRRAALAVLVIGVGAVVVGLPVRAAEKKRVLVGSHTAGVRHEWRPVGGQTIQARGERTGQWEAGCARTAGEVRAGVTAENPRRYDLLFFNNTTGELPIPDEGKKAFMDWLRGGKGFVGVRAATDTF